jgi:alpha-amylase
MSSVCFYFQVHQPFRLRKASYQDFRNGHHYFDEHANGAIMRKVAQKCYLPMNHLLKELIQRFDGKFKVSFSITGVAVEQMQLYAPEVLESFMELAETGAVEFIGETYYHSLAALYDRDEFLDQVSMHSHMINSLFNQKPTVFRNTELIYDDHVGALAAEAGYKGVIAEGVDDILGWRSPNYLYSVQGHDCKLLLKNYRLSDDIAFRFSNQGWKEFPLTADKFANWVHAISGGGDVLNLFMDYETFGEHQWSSTGIFEFMRYLPEMILKHPDWNFATPSELIERYPSRSEMHFHRTTSWADMERDLTAWRGNRMQQSSLDQIFELGKYIRRMEDPTVLGIWRKLLTSDHYYYMCTKWFADGDVHAYFSPYESPYEAFVTFMNAFKDFKEYFTDQALARTFL